jgi:hypothetical protein
VVNEARKHHYVPRSVLRNFTFDGKGRQLYVFDKHSGQIFPASVSNAGAERDFNCVQICSVDYNFESLFQDLDGRLAQLIAKIIKDVSVSNLSEEDKSHIPLLIACQLVRTKLQRTTPVEISQQLSEWFRKLGLPQPQAITDEDARRIAFRQLLQIDKFGTPINKNDLVLLHSSEKKFWISDNPVVVNNSFPYGQTGLESPGIEIYYPISSQLCLAFYCPSIRQILQEAFDQDHPRPSPRDPYMANLYQALVEGETLEIPPNIVERLNALQVSQSSRFLYSCSDDFEQAQTIISVFPKVANVRSRLILGSSAVPPAQNLPDGTWLVAEKGYRHHALAITLRDDDSPFINFYTTDQQKLAVIEQGCPLDCVTVYENGQGIKGMREVVFRYICEDGDSFIRAEHDNQGLNIILERT